MVIPFAPLMSFRWPLNCQPLFSFTGCKVCKFAHPDIKNMTYSGAFPDYDKGKLAEVQVSMDLSRAKRQGSATHQFYLKHVLEWACKCGDPDSTAILCEAVCTFMHAACGYSAQDLFPRLLVAASSCLPTRLELMAPSQSSVVWTTKPSGSSWMTKSSTSTRTSRLPVVQC